MSSEQIFVVVAIRCTKGYRGYNDEYIKPSESRNKRTAGAASYRPGGLAQCNANCTLDMGGGHNSHSARVSADKVLKRLVAQGGVMRRDSSLRTSVYILTKAGALRANEGLTHPLFRHGYDLSHLDSARQRPAVDYLITQHHQGKIAMGIAGLRKAMELGLIQERGFRGADGVVIDDRTGEFKPILVIRNTHPELVKKAKRIRKAVGDLELIGSAGLIRFFRNEMRS